MGAKSISVLNNDGVEQAQSMDSLLADEQLDVMLPRRGELRKGTIAHVSPNEILVDIGSKSEGVISEQEVSQMNDEVRSQLQEGNLITLYVVREASKDGPVVLSLQKVEEIQQWQDTTVKMEKSIVVTGTILESNRGGVVVSVGQLRGFLPASQMTLEHRRLKTGSSPAERWKGLVGESVAFKFLEVNEQESKLILSERAAEKEVRAAQRTELLRSIEPGQRHSGRVVSLANFGAFVDIGGIDGLVHISQLSWEHIDHPRERLVVGQEVDVEVLSVDHKRQRVGLSLKSLQEDPWVTLTDRYREGQLVHATITRMTSFGAFAKLKDGDHIEGLVHISELAEGMIAHPKEVVKENEEITLRIMKIDSENHRLSLSLKKVTSATFAELDYAFYVDSKMDAQPDPCSDPIDVPTAPTYSDDPDKDPPAASSTIQEQVQLLSESVESDERVKTDNDIDVQNPRQITDGEIE